MSMFRTSDAFKYNTSSTKNQSSSTLNTLMGLSQNDVKFLWYP